MRQEETGGNRSTQEERGEDRRRQERMRQEEGLDSITFVFGFHL